MREAGTYRFASLQELVDKYHPIMAVQQPSKDQNEPMRDEEEAGEPNMEFVGPFDTFLSFGKAAGFIEDWIRTKKNNATDFTNDLPAILERAKQIRKVLTFVRSQNPSGSGDLKPDVETESEVKNMNKLIYTSQLCENEGDYLFFFLLNLIESCCARPEVPLIVIRIAWNQLKLLIDEDKIKIKLEHQQFAIERLDKIRTEIVHEFYKHLQLQNHVSTDYFEELVRVHIENTRFAEASNLIIRFNLFEKFDLIELMVGLVEANKPATAKLFLDSQPSLREKVIRRLSTSEHAKTASDFVKDYKLNPEDFPELQSLMDRNCSNYFIGRAFKNPSNADYLPLSKIEDLFTNRPRMLVELVQSLLKKGQKMQAKGVWQRHGLHSCAPPELQQEMNSFAYDPAQDIMPEDKFAPCTLGENLHLPKEVTVKFIGCD